MSKYVDRVIALSEEIMVDNPICPNCVSIDDIKIQEVSQNMIAPPTSAWRLSSEIETHLSKCPAGMRIKIITVYELLASSINYCYWYGWSSLRPSGSGSSYVYKMLDDSIVYVMSNTSHVELVGISRIITKIVTNFKKRLQRSRITMLRERLNHISELEPNICKFVDDLYEHYASYDFNIDNLFDKVFDNFPGFAEDLFLKRLTLLIMQLNRRLSWFNNAMSELIVPADYQIPKILRNMGCLHYSTSLSDKIHYGELIPKYSCDEIRIRAATILACRKIAQLSNLTCEQVDSVLWLSRKIASPHHLTVTTDY